MRRRALGVAVSHRFPPPLIRKAMLGRRGGNRSYETLEKCKKGGSGLEFGENFVCDIGGEYININLCHDSPGYF